MARLEELADLGQSIWYDYIRRFFLTRGELKKLVEMGLRGVTSNPAIFEKAIAGSADYDDALLQSGLTEKSPEEIYEALAVEDIAMAADELRTVYEGTNGRDGYVSFEVSPELAHSTERTVSEGKRLFAAVARPNLMIKVPATEEGVPAIIELIGSGVNVNVTLLFGVANYLAVAEAFLAGLERLADRGPSVPGGHTVAGIASVASFFVSRVDTAVDQALEKGGNRELQGKIAIANAKIAYAEYGRIFRGARWERLAAQGARSQRLLWASTGTKNPQYSDTLYVDELIGPETVNTVPPATFEMFLDHGKAAMTLTVGIEEARAQVARLADLGIDLAAVTRKLQADGVAAFESAYRSLIESVQEKRNRLRSDTRSNGFALGNYQPMGAKIRRRSPTGWDGFTVPRSWWRQFRRFCPLLMRCGGMVWTGPCCWGWGARASLRRFSGRPSASKRDTWISRFWTAPIRERCWKRRGPSIRLKACLLSPRNPGAQWRPFLS
jgi:transaldolase